MFDTEDNFTTNGSGYGNYSDGYGRKGYPLIELYLAVPLRLIMSLAIVISASIVLLAIKRSKRRTTSLHFFFIANLMIADIGVAVIRNGAAIVNMIITIVNPMREGIDCRIIAVTVFPMATSSIMLTALCFDRLYSIAAPHHYRSIMTKRRGYAIVLVIWLVSFLLSFTSFLDPHLSSTKTKGAICGTPLYKNFGLVVVVLPLFLTAVFVVIQNIYLYCVVVKITTRHSIKDSGNTTAATGMRRTLKETKKASITLLILSGVSIFFGVVHPVTTTIIQSQVGYDLFKAIWFSIIMAFNHLFNTLLHSVLYGFFLHSIRELLGINVCQCFRNVSDHPNRRNTTTKLTN